MNLPKPKISRLTLKRSGRSKSTKAKILSKISCKIGGHFLNAHIDTGSSISIASNDLHRKLLYDQCSFEEGRNALHLADDLIDEVYCTTSVTVTVIGKTKSINLVAFPNIKIKKTILGMDFLSSSSSKKSTQNETFKVPKEPVPRPKRTTKREQTRSEENDVKPAISLFDWILNSNNLQTPLYNILTDGTATDHDVLEICSFMKKMPRPISPIRPILPRPKKFDSVVVAKKSAKKYVHVPIPPPSKQ